MKWTTCFGAGLLFVFLATPSHAKRFRNSYLSFELPTNWECTAEGTDWLCFSKFEQKSKEAIIILTAKMAGPTDNIDEYDRYLKQPRSIVVNSGMPGMSKVESVKKRKIGDHDWIDALHLASEVETYYTRYLGTVKNGLAVLVTFSAHKAYYTKYSADFIRAIESLDVVAPADFLQRIGVPGGTGSDGAGGGIGSGTMLGPDVGMGPVARRMPKNKDGVSLREIIFGLGLILAAIALYLWMKNRNSGGKKMVKKVLKVRKPMDGPENKS